MRDYSPAYGAAVRQRTNRQETTMARHGTMPEVIYQRHLQIRQVGRSVYMKCPIVREMLVMLTMR